MKMKFRPCVLPLVSALLLALTACYPSLNPLYKPEDLVFDLALTGTWRGEDPNESWTFSMKDRKSYALVFREKEKSSPYVARLAKIQGQLFLDVTPDPAGWKGTPQEDWFQIAYIPGHLIYKISRIEPDLQYAILKPEWLEELFKTKPSALAHVKLDGGPGYAITATTEDLQKFLLKELKNKEAWGEIEKPLTKGK